MPNSERSAALSTMGRRDHNEDSFAADEALGLFAVADGVGGNAAGEVASAVAIAAARTVIRQWRADPTSMTAQAAANRAVDAASSAVYEASQLEPERHGMATTLTLMLVDGRLGYMAHVGDSRLYIVREDGLHQLSTDHTLAAELVRGGVIPREQVATHPHAHVLTRSCGSQPSVAVETLQFELHPDDVYLLSSDGLNPVMDEPESVVDVLGPGRSLVEGLATLVERAKAKGSSDNITAVVWRCVGEAQPSAGSTIAVLRQVRLFERLLTADLFRVANVLVRRQVARGEVLVERGETTHRLVVVGEGELHWELEPGRHAALQAGDSIGLTTLMASRRSPGRLVAGTDAEVLLLSGKDFRRLCRRRERLGVALLGALATELSEWTDPDSDRGLARPPHGVVVAF